MYCSSSPFQKKIWLLLKLLSPLAWQWGTANAEIKAPSAKNRELLFVLKALSFKFGVFQNIALHALPTATLLNFLALLEKKKDLFEWTRQVESREEDIRERSMQGCILTTYRLCRENFSQL